MLFCYEMRICCKVIDIMPLAKFPWMTLYQRHNKLYLNKLHYNKNKTDTSQKVPIKCNVACGCYVTKYEQVQDAFTFLHGAVIF